MGTSRKRVVRKVMGKVSDAANATAKLLPVITENVVPLITDNVVPLVLSNKSEKVSVPKLCSKDHIYKLQYAKEKLEGLGLKVMAVPLSIEEADIHYKDCVPFQVVYISPKGKSKVKIGSLVEIRYVTEDVIRESKRRYIEMMERRHRHRLAYNKKNKS